jgi:hypothetical protein
MLTAGMGQPFHNHQLVLRHLIGQFRSDRFRVRRSVGGSDLSFKMIGHPPNNRIDYRASAVDLPSLGNPLLIVLHFPVNLPVTLPGNVGAVPLAELFPLLLLNSQILIYLVDPGILGRG